MTLKSPRILCVGDLLLDVYIEGTTPRMSPEAACPVFLESGKNWQQAGGAAAVANMCAALGADVTLVGCLGFDDDRQSVLDQLHERVKPKIVNAPGGTTVKHRFVTPLGQVLRVDRECQSRSWSAKLWTHAWKAIASILRDKASYDMLLIADYGKGVCNGPWLKSALDGYPRSLVDPARGRTPEDYAGAWLIKPNEVERAAWTGGGLPECISRVLTTMGKHGMQLAQRVPEFDTHGIPAWQFDDFPARFHPLRDVTGAGDQVLSTLGVCLGSGMDLIEACRWANEAAGMQCERERIVPVGREELIRAMTGGKLISQEAAAEIALGCRTTGYRVVFTNGCFDLCLTSGHVASLTEAKAQGHLLFVGLNSDSSVNTVKGTVNGRKRPIRPQAERAALLEALACVDYVVLFDEPTPQALIEAIRPDVLVKGGDYAGREAEIPGAEFVRQNGGRVHITRLVEGVSTTQIANCLSQA